MWKRRHLIVAGLVALLATGCDQASKLQAVATLGYSASGKLVRYRIDTPSGNKQFDDSLKRAIVKSQQLPQPLPKALELVVIFNLKDMAASNR
ncbi:MAG: TonB C-terminal domain-containing protein [Deltaproteobacteria bacterium]|nr:TonB C-terminal domain-containing protein [Deltaproteobacteria bacterium]